MLYFTLDAGHPYRFKMLEDIFKKNLTNSASLKNDSLPKFSVDISTSKPCFSFSSTDFIIAGTTFSTTFEMTVVGRVPCAQGKIF